MVSTVVAVAAPLITAGLTAAAIAATAGAIAGVASGFRVSPTANNLAGGLATFTETMNGPIGCIVLGAQEKTWQLQSDGECHQKYSWDCWKAILHDDSEEASSSMGRRLRDVLLDARVHQVLIDWTTDRSPDERLPVVNCAWPRFIVRNIWNELFLIYYVQLPGMGITAAHAVKLDLRAAMRSFVLRGVRNLLISYDCPHCYAHKRSAGSESSRKVVKLCKMERSALLPGSANIQQLLLGRAVLFPS